VQVHVHSPVHALCDHHMQWLTGTLGMLLWLGSAIAQHLLAACTATLLLYPLQLFSAPLVTELVPASTFYVAEKYHQVSTAWCFACRRLQRSPCQHWCLPMCARLRCSFQSSELHARSDASSSAALLRPEPYSGLLRLRGWTEGCEIQIQVVQAAEVTHSKALRAFDHSHGLNWAYTTPWMLLSWTHNTPGCCG
jgi:hypothetical protein